MRSDADARNSACSEEIRLRIVPMSGDVGAVGSRIILLLIYGRDAAN